MAGPIRRPSGRWQIRWVDADGRRRGQTFASHSAAAKALRQREVEADHVRAGLFPRRDETDEHDFDELADYWLKHRTAHKRSPKDDHSILRCHLRPAFGGLRLKHIDARAIDRLFTKLTAAGLAASTVSHVMGLLGSMLSKAVDLGWLAAKPKVPRPKSDQEDFNWVDSLDAVHRLLACAAEEEVRVRATGKSIDGLHALYATSVFTGARQGEVAALKWGMVDLNLRLITIARSFDKTTKTKAIRRVPILDALLPILRQWRLRCPPTEGDWVFPNSRGKMHVPGARVFGSIYQRVLKSAGVVGHHAERRLTYHDLRHTMASLWVQNGGDLFKLQKILGHQSVRMTLRYAHLAPAAFSDNYGQLGASRFGSSNVVELAAHPQQRKEACDA